MTYTIADIRQAFEAGARDAMEFFANNRHIPSDQMSRAASLYCNSVQPDREVMPSAAADSGPALPATPPVDAAMVSTGVQDDDGFSDPDVYIDYLQRDRRRLSSELAVARYVVASLRDERDQANVLKGQADVLKDIANRECAMLRRQLAEARAALDEVADVADDLVGEITRGTRNPCGDDYVYSCTIGETWLTHVRKALDAARGAQ